MHARNYLSISALILFLFLACGCSGSQSDAVAPDTERDTTGIIATPVDPGTLDPGTLTECQRFFKWHGGISFYMDPQGPHTIPMALDGGIRIKDKDCSATISDVIVTFKANYYEFHSYEIPGTKVKMGNHTYYFGTITTSETLLGGGWIVEEAFYLETYPDPSGITPVAGDTIEGWYHVHRDDWMLISGGYIVHDHHYADLNIYTGKEVFLGSVDPHPID